MARLRTGGEAGRRSRRLLASIHHGVKEAQKINLATGRDDSTAVEHHSGTGALPLCRQATTVELAWGLWRSCGGHHAHGGWR